MQHDGRLDSERSSRLQRSKRALSFCWKNRWRLLMARRLRQAPMLPPPLPLAFSRRVKPMFHHITNSRGFRRSGYPNLHLGERRRERLTLRAISRMLVCQSLPDEGMVLRSTYDSFQPGCVVLFEQLQLFVTASRRNGARKTAQDQTVSARRMICVSNRTKSADRRSTKITRSVLLQHKTRVTVT